MLLVDILNLAGEVVTDGSIAKEEIFDKPAATKEKFLTVNNAKFEIIINAPWIRNLKLPSCILQGCFVYPCKYEHQFGLDEQTTFQWSQQNGKEYIPVGEGKSILKNCKIELFPNTCEQFHILNGFFFL